MERAKIIIEIDDGRVTKITADEDILIKVVHHEDVTHEVPFRFIEADLNFEEVSAVLDQKIRRRFYKEEGP